jgi:hypothetical protein
MQELNVFEVLRATAPKVRNPPIVLKNSTMDAGGCGGTERLSG